MDNFCSNGTGSIGCKFIIDFCSVEAFRLICKRFLSEDGVWLVCER